MPTYPKVESVTPLCRKRLRVMFVTGTAKIYDCAHLLTEDSFALLADDAFFRNVHADSAGYGICWNDNVDLSESELWIHGAIESPNSLDE